MEVTLVYPTSGNEYVGHLPVGQLTGTGTFRCAKNGAVYTGEYEGNRFHGIGELTWATGDVHRGQWKGGLMEGDGVFTWADGRVYRGQWKGDKIEGDGVYTFASGDVYRGQYKGDEMEGDGVYAWANGDVYRGQYKGKMEGDGVYTYVNGGGYRGQWKGDEREGDGVYTFADGRQTFGQFKGGKEVSSVPYDAANPAHAAVLRAANEAEAGADEASEAAAAAEAKAKGATKAAKTAEKAAQKAAGAETASVAQKAAAATAAAAHAEPKPKVAEEGAAPPQLGGLTVAQLRELCAKHGLPKTGVKADLLARLRAKLCSDGPPAKKQKIEAIAQLTPMFPALPASAIADALGKAGGDVQQAANALFAEQDAAAVANNKHKEESSAKFNAVVDESAKSSAATPRRVREWSVADVQAFFVALELGEYNAAIKKEKVDGRMLQDLMAEDGLGELGIKSKVHLLRIKHGLEDAAQDHAKHGGGPETRTFFVGGMVFRTVGFLATSYKKEKAKQFVDRVEFTGLVNACVMWRIELDPIERCNHVNLVTAMHVPGEFEFLFSAYSAFEVVRVHWSPTPQDKARPHEITLRAFPDNRTVSEDVPLAPWS